MSQTLQVPFSWDWVRRGVFAAALALCAMLLQDLALPGNGDLSVMITGICILLFAASLTGRAWFLTRLGAALAVAGLTMNLLNVYGHLGSGLSEGCVVGALAGIAAGMLRPLRPWPARVEQGRVASGETVAARW